MAAVWKCSVTLLWCFLWQCGQTFGDLGMLKIHQPGSELVRPDYHSARQIHTDVYFKFHLNKNEQKVAGNKRVNEGVLVGWRYTL